MSSSAAAGGASVTIQWSRGPTTINAMEWDRVIWALENWLIDRGRKTRFDSWKAAKDAGLMTPEVVDQKIDQFDKDVDAGLYSFGSPDFMAILSSAFGTKAGGDVRIHPGIFELLKLMTGLSLADAIFLFKEKKDEVISKLTLMMRRSLPTPDADDPNSKGAATE